jgi:hypothetical protein
MAFFKMVLQLAKATARDRERERERATQGRACVQENILQAGHP